MSLEQLSLAPAAASDQAVRRSLVDAFGRHITYLRLSITDRCDMRCLYCMGEHNEFLPKNELMTAAELVGIANAFIDRGIRTIRLTGGEPLTRRDVVQIATALGQRIGHGLDALTMTSNGSQLARYAAELFAAGIRRVNVSVDTLNAEDFTRITRGGRLNQVMDGLAAAQASGLSIRVNMVAMAGINEDQIVPMADWCEASGFDLAVIESMPLGDVGVVRADSHIALDAFLAPLVRGNASFESLTHRTAGPARYVTLPGRSLRLGLITPLSNNFCAGCNRVRMSADGKVHACLGHDDSLDFLSAWRQGGAPALDDLLDRLMFTKAERHHFQIGPGTNEIGPKRRMHATGG